MYELEIADQQTCMTVDERWVNEAVRHTLTDERVSAARISVALVDNQTIHGLNRRYLGHDTATDVLSFLLECTRPETEQTGETVPQQILERPDGSQAESKRRGAGKRIEGEVIVSTEMAAQSAEHFRWIPERELLLYLVHGVLHLCGYDDRSPVEQSLMRQREREILQRWNATPHYDDNEANNLSVALPLPANQSVVDDVTGAES